MKRLWIRKFGMIFLPAVVAVIAAALPVAAVPNDLTYGENEMEILAHGPVHEAFAETVAFDPEPGIIVPKAPPEPINEIQPDQKPDGNVDWIPGYWGWDDDRNDFIWISGTWRAVPPGRRWVPGYWIVTAEGYQWIAGYWASQANSTTTYLPEPPESMELGPNVNAPSPNHTWIPGCWIWYQNTYAWRPGYWAPVRTDWVWIPAHYVWTPMGYVFVGGYWDFAVGSRGLFFAPVAFGVSFAFGSGFYFRPSFVINLGVFSNCLFLRPRYHHYYFGDYYATRYYQKGIYPWFSPHARRHGYDPIYAHQRWKHRNDPHWKRNLQATYQLRLRNHAARPPRTLLEAKRLKSNAITAKASGRGLQQPFNPLIKDNVALPKPNAITGSPERARPSLSVRAVSSKRKTVQASRMPSVKSPESRTTTFSVSNAPQRRPKWASVTTVRKSSPARYQTPKTDSTVQLVQQKPIKTWGKKSSRPSPDRKRASAPDTRRLWKSPSAPPKPAGQGAPKKLPEVQKSQGGLAGGWHRPEGPMPGIVAGRPSMPKR
jgi:hypothetical protein